ncbi:MAG: hypothetical protein IKX89_00995 [Firmicutes bacterium]|nr:hypothetical protein [Bacillota bacterium]
MGFLDKLKEVGDKAKEGAAIAADKAKDFAETTKQKAKIAEAEKGIKDVYTSIGKLLFEQFPDLAAEKFPEQIGKIGEFNKAIEAAKAVIASLADDDKVKEEVKEEIKEGIVERTEEAAE